MVDIAPVPKATSPPRYAAGCDDDEDDEEEAQSVSTLAPPLRVPLDPEPVSKRPEGARMGGGGWGKLDRSADTEMSLSLDGRSLAALANASFDVPTDEENDMFISDSDVEGSNVGGLQDDGVHAHPREDEPGAPNRRENNPGEVQQAGVEEGETTRRSRVQGEG